MSGIVYRGVSDGAMHDHVYVERDGATAPLHHYVKKSLGFSWGYGGSGPAELARCILADYLQLQPLPEDAPAHLQAGPGSIPEIDGGLFQEFKFAFLAPLQQNVGWEISGAQIAEWLEAHPPVKTCPVHRIPVDLDDVELAAHNHCYLCLEDATQCAACKGEGMTEDCETCPTCHGSGLKENRDT